MLWHGRLQARAGGLATTGDAAPSSGSSGCSRFRRSADEARDQVERLGVVGGVAPGSPSAQRCVVRTFAKLPGSREETRVRLRDRRRRLGRLRAGGAPLRGSRRQGGAARGGGRGLRAGDPRAERLRLPVQDRPSTGTSTASRSRGSAAAALYLPRGRVLGGSSSINAQIYIRGNRADYDEWAAGGADGLELRRGAALLQARRGQRARRGRFHGVGGPLSVSDSRSNHPLVDAMIEATKQAGHEHNPDLNGARQEGVGRFQLTQRDGLRCSAAVRLPAPGDGAAEPDRDPARAGDADPLRRQPRRRRRVRARREARGGPRRARGDPVGRRLPVAACC